MSAHAFLDESKANGYVIAAAIVFPHRLGAARQAMRGLCLPGQQRVHLSKEQPARRRQILAAVCRLDIEVRIYDASGIQNPRAARSACLEQVIADLAALRGQRLVIEQDDSLVSADQADLWTASHKYETAATLAYEHVPPRTEPLLWIADAAVWSWSRGGQWRQRIDPVVRRVTTL